MALVVPSVCFEVFPMVILEALAEGTPVVARDLAGMAEMIRDSGGGLLFSDETGLQSALDRLQADPALRRALGDSGRRTFLERWTSEVHVQRYLAVIEGCREARLASPGARGTGPEGAG
jgi:glycosyltransferase involved in cell wall biosynthesis